MLPWVPSLFSTRGLPTFHQPSNRAADFPRIVAISHGDSQFSTLVAATEFPYNLTFQSHKTIYTVPPRGFRRGRTVCRTLLCSSVSILPPQNFRGGGQTPCLPPYKRKVLAASLAHFHSFPSFSSIRIFLSAPLDVSGEQTDWDLTFVSLNILTTADWPFQFNCSCKS
jgi:hypothetical protein